MNKLLFFPIGYPDEDFRSIIYRYHVRSGNRNLRGTSKELFGTSNMTYGHIPRRMKYFIEHLPYNHKYSIDYFLENHTFLPFFKSFIAMEDFKRYIDNIYEGNLNHTHRPKNILGVNRNLLLSQSIRYCPDCMEEDYEKFGESYVHLNHQIKIINICTVHKVRLMEKCQVCQEEFSMRNLNLTPNCSKGHKLAKQLNDTLMENEELGREVLGEISYIKDNCKDLSPSIINFKLISILGNQGYIHSNGTVNKRKVIQDVFCEYTDVDLANIGIDKKKMLTRESIKKFLTDKHISNYPVFYLLIVNHYFGSFKKMIEYSKTYSVKIPFGTGPWECVNNLCEGYKKKLILSRKLHRFKVDNKINGTFYCNLCGFVYSRVFKDSDAQELNKKNISIKKNGWLWEQEVIRLYVEGKTITYIGKYVNSSSKTVKKFLLNKFKIMGFQELDNNLLEPSRRLPKDIISSFSEIASSTTVDYKEYKQYEKNESYRRRIKELKKSNPNISRGEVHRLDRRAIGWLLQYDNSWLDDNLPIRDTTKYNTKALANIDKDLSQKIRIASINLYKSNPQNRISRNLILNQLSKREKKLIVNYSTKLVKINKEIEKNTESLQDFLIRIVPVIVERAKTQGLQKITFKTLTNLVSSYSKCTPNTREIIEKELEKY